MYGKIFETMYEGSMMGAGSAAFAVWGYVLAKMKPDKEVGAQVDLNPELMGVLIGEKEEIISKAIASFCRPDPRSRTPDEEGRRLVRLGQFAYRVVNGAKYLAIRNEEERRESDRARKRKERASKKPNNGKPLPGEQAYEKILKREGQDAADKFAEGLNTPLIKEQPAAPSPLDLPDAEIPEI